MRISSPYTGSNYRAGGNYAVCDECGVVYRMRELRKRWDGALVCPRDWEARHPQEQIRGVADKMRVKEARVELFKPILNDQCTTSNGWVVGVGWEYDSGAYRFRHSGGIDVLTRTISGLTIGQKYMVNIMAVGYESGHAIVSLGVSTDESGDTVITFDRQYNTVFTAADDEDSLVVSPSADFIGSIAGVIVTHYVGQITGADL